MSRLPVIVWYRRDLRLRANPALSAALRTGAPVVPVFVWSPEEEGRWAPGAASRWWLHQSLARLNESLHERESRLIVRRGPAAQSLLEVARACGARTAYWNRLYDPVSAARDAAVESQLEASGMSADSFAGDVLVEPQKLANHHGEPFRVFTPFWKACLKEYERRDESNVPARFPGLERWPASLTVRDLELEPAIDWACGMRESWCPGEKGASRALQSFLSGGWKIYAKGRDLPDRHGTSQLSPHLHFGEVSPHQIWNAVASQEGATEEDPYLRELVWREFAQHLLCHYPATTEEPMRPEFRTFPWRMDERLFRAWTKGQTGYPIVDAGMRQLWHTGWMHNRVRMVVGSFLVKHLLIPWQEGAAWFWDTLVDGDLANNTLGWQWVAGCGADAAPYFRIFNPVLQGEKFDAQGEYVRRWVPELAQLPDKAIHQPWTAPAEVLRAADVRLGENYPRPIVEHQAARARALAAFAKRDSLRG